MAKAGAKAIALILDKLLTKLFLPYKKEQIEQLIESNVNAVDLLRECEAEWQDGQAEKWKPHSKTVFMVMMKLLAFSRMAVRRLPPDVVDAYLKPEVFVDWAMEKRPDLADVLSTPEGSAWLVDLAEDVRQLLYGDVA